MLILLSPMTREAERHALQSSSKTDSSFPSIYMSLIFIYYILLFDVLKFSFIFPSSMLLCPTTNYPFCPSSFLILFWMTVHLAKKLIFHFLFLGSSVTVLETKIEVEICYKFFFTDMGFTPFCLLPSSYLKDGCDGKSYSSSQRTMRKRLRKFQNDTSLTS